MVIIRKIEPAEFFKLVTEEQVTLDCMPPTMIKAALNHPIDEATCRRMPPMRIGTAGSAPPMATIQGAQEKFGWRGIQSYGLMETSPLITVSNVKPTMRGLSEEEKLRWQTKTSYPMVGFDVRAVDEGGEDIAPNSLEAGEVVFHTGDMALIDGEGFIEVVDRKKDLIISGGENVSFIEVEGLLYK